MLRSLRCAALFGGLILSASALAADIDAASYGYPLTNPFEATIATTPPELRPETISIRRIAASHCARSVNSACRTTSGR